MNRQIGLDFGTTTSVLAYRDFDRQNEGTENLVKFNGHDYVPTLVLSEGSITNKKGILDHIRAPWLELQKCIKKVCRSLEVTSIGTQAFDGCDQFAESVYVPTV